MGCGVGEKGTGETWGLFPLASSWAEREFSAVTLGYSLMEARHVQISSTAGLSVAHIQLYIICCLEVEHRAAVQT